ncbi:pentalenene oxygenase [Actinomadura mexicana]|uniref:Pentalenene oxygenase n=1 Tax=Actinomadura mexicana TaxID=134959 RepID=A0A238XNF4_9ACTN|nr:pentalenene oxygenase [Actinomadura mexicana]
MIGTAPGNLPLAGHALSLLFRPLEFLRTLPSFGDLVKIRMGLREVYVPCRPDLFRQILRDARTYDKGGPFYDRLREIGGNGLVTSRWDVNRRRRPLMQPSFDHEHINRYAELMADEVNALTRTWRSGETIDVDRAMETLTLRITARALFSVPADHRSVAQVERWLPILMEGIYRRMLVPAPVLSLAPTKINRGFPRATAAIRELTEEFIDAARRKEGQDEGLLSVLLNAPNEETGAPLQNHEIFDEVLTLMVAGTETTARALAFVFHLLGAHPEAAARLREEVDGSLGGRTPRFDDLPKLAFTRQVIMESLRLYPPAWMLSRVSTAAGDIGGHEFPEGTMFLLSPYLVHYDPDLFPSPESFVPDRWRPGGMSQEARRSVVPFASGPRKCIGDQFALTEAMLAVATIAARWSLSPLTDRPLRPVARANLGPGRLPMRLRERRPGPVQAATTTDGAEREAGRS